MRFVLAVAGACLLLLAGVAVVVAAMSMGGPEILPLALIMPSALGGVRAALLRRAATQSRRT